MRRAPAKFKLSPHTQVAIQDIHKFAHMGKPGISNMVALEYSDLAKIYIACMELAKDESLSTAGLGTDWLSRAEAKQKGDELREMMRGIRVSIMASLRSDDEREQFLREFPAPAREEFISSLSADGRKLFEKATENIASQESKAEVAPPLTKSALT